MTVPLLDARRQWECPNCDFTDVTVDPVPHSRMHSCRGLNGLTAPMIPAGTKAKVYTVGREDYEGTDIAARDGEGNVVSQIVTIRDEGQDCVVLAPTAVVEAGA